MATESEDRVGTPERILYIRNLRENLILTSVCQRKKNFISMFTNTYKKLEDMQTGQLDPKM
jgi:hypothetical protein